MIDLATHPITEIQNLLMPKGFAEKLEETLRKVDANHADMQLSYVLLFGSAARGSAFFGSDLDLLFLTTAPTEREVRLLVLKHEIDDDTAYVPVQITVRKLCRFLDPAEDVTGFHRSIAPDLVLLRRYL